MRFAWIRVTVVELGDGASADQGTEFLERARRLGNRHRQDGFALFAHLGAFGDKTQAVEVHVGARGNCDQRPALRLVALDVFLDAGNGECARRLQDRARVLEHILDRGADGIGVDQYHFINVLPAEAEGLFADQLDGGAVGEQADLVELDALAGLQ